MPTFGDTTSGTDSFPGDIDRALLDRFTLSEDGTVDSLTFFFEAGTNPGTSFKGLIYTDNAGAPGTLVAVSAAGSAVDGWVTVNFASEALTAADYWTGIVCNGSDAVLGADTTGSAPDTAMMNGTLSYASPPSTCPTPDVTYGIGLNVYVTYTAGGGGQVTARNGITLANLTAINGIALSGVSALNGLTT